MNGKIWDVIGTIAGILIFAFLIAIVLGANLLIAGGNWRCAFSQDPALCATVGDVDR